MKEEKEKQFRKDSELELSKERKEVRDGRIGLSKDAENKSRLSKAEEKRRTVFEMKKKEFLSQVWRTADLTVGMVYANVMAILLGLPIILFLFILYLLRLFYGPESAAASWRGADFVLIFLFCLLLIFVHELIHGITWAVFAKKGRKAISFGFIPQYLTPYCTCNEPLKKGKYITGALMPTLLLGLLPAAGAIVTGSAVLFCISAVMIFAGGGDLTIVLKLRRYKTESSEVLYLDHPYQAGLVVFLRP